MKDFVKLYATILDSSVWGESKDTRILWVTMLAMANEHGQVEASVGGLARRAQLTREECESALSVLEAPDPDDKSGVAEGRRIHRTERGWFITNHRYYRDFRTDSQVKGAARVAKHRAKTKGVTPVTGNDVTPGNAEQRTEVEEDSEEDLDQEAGGDPARADAPPATPTVSEHQATEPKLTICPLNLVEKAEAVGIVEQFARHYQVEPEQIREGIREFVSHWTIGTGAGRKDTNWFRRLRGDLKFKCETPGKLKPIGELQHVPATREARQQRAADQGGLRLMREAEELAAGRGPTKAQAGVVVKDLSKALGGRP